MFIFVAIALLATNNIASATVGGPKIIENIGYDSATKKIYYSVEDYSGRGCPTWISYITLDTNKAGDVESCDQLIDRIYDSSDPNKWKEHDSEIRAFFKALQALNEISLEKNHITVKVTAENAVRVEGELMYTMLRANVSQDGNQKASLAFRGCDANQLNTFHGYEVPKTNTIVFVISGDGDCVEGGYRTDTLHLVKGITYYDTTVQSEDAGAASGVTDDNDTEDGRPQPGDDSDNNNQGQENDDSDGQDADDEEDDDFGIFFGKGKDASGNVIPAATEEGRAEVAKIILADLKESGVPVQSVLINTDKVETKVEHRVKLFALFPINTTATVEIDANEQVKVKFPWWSFLASGKDKKGIGERTFTAISNVLKTKHDTVKNSIGNIR